MKTGDWYITSEDEAQFIEYLKLTGASPISIKNWRSDLKNFVLWSKEENNPDLSSDDILLRYRRYLLSIGSASHTINRKVNTTSKFIEWYLNKHQIQRISTTESANNSSKPLANDMSKNSSRQNRGIWYGLIISIMLTLVLIIGFFALISYQSYKKTNYYSAPIVDENNNNYIKYDGYLSQNGGLLKSANVSLLFKLYNNKEDTVPVYVGSCDSVTPNKSGFFTIRIGLDCGMGALPQNIKALSQGIFLSISNKNTGREIIREYIPFDLTKNLTPTPVPEGNVNIFISDDAFVDIEDNLTSGDIVTRSQSGLKKAKKGDILIGVRAQDKVIVSGVAEVRVSTQEGQITRGDIISIGETAGIGQRGILTGYDSIGIALEDYNATESGKIKIILRPGY